MTWPLEVFLSLVLMLILGKTKGSWGRDKGVRSHSQFEIVDDLEAALEQFRLIANDLGSEPPEKMA